MPEKTIILAATIDDAYVLPLLVVLRSACRSLAAGWGLRVFVIGDQIGAGSRRRLEEGIAGLPVEVEWRTLDLECVRNYWPGVATGGSITLYYRLYLAEALPEWVKRVLFVDADILVEGDLAELWNLPFDGHTVQAAADAYGRLHVSRLAAIEFDEGIEFRRGSDYFNAGVMLVDLARWRKENAGGRATAFLWKYRDRLAGRDQDALNCALAGRWKPLPIAWNFHELPQGLHVWEAAKTPPDELKRAVRHPKIIHFIGSKPWDADCLHIYRRRWWRVAGEVSFPKPPQRLLERLHRDLIRTPHFELHWHRWRGLIHTRDPWHWGRIALLLLIRPWMLISYPLWRISTRFTKP